jgi:hypothetical protein
MPVCDRKDIPDTVGRGTLDPSWKHGCPPGRRWAPTSRSRSATATKRKLASDRGRRSGRWTPLSCQGPMDRLLHAVTRPRSCGVLQVNLVVVAHRAIWDMGSIPRRHQPHLGSGIARVSPIRPALQPAGDHHTPGWCALVDPGIHGSVLRRQRPAEPAGSAGRGASLCGISCVIKTAQVMRPF